MGCDEVLLLLAAREAACLGEVECLQVEAERIAVLLATCEQELARIATARQVVAEFPPVHRPAGTGSAAVVVPAPRKAAGPSDGGSREQLLAVLGPVWSRDQLPGSPTVGRAGLVEPLL
jgi:hypothetical protein